jgi:hypothetical protein
MISMSYQLNGRSLIVSICMNQCRKHALVFLGAAQDQMSDIEIYH